MFFFKGFKFGMLLQLAIGPVCLFIFQTAHQAGFGNALTGVIGVALVDALYILLAILGITAFLETPRTKTVCKWFGCSILLCFGIATFYEALQSHSTPISFNHQAKFNTSPFLQGIFLTAANPLTILFWSGFFAAKTAADKLTRPGMYCFGGGAVAATVFFLTLVCLLGSYASIWLPLNYTKYLNLTVGLLFIFFAVKLLLKRS